MSTIQRRVSLLLGAAVAALAFTAAPALAVDDFPHEPEANKWQAIAAYDWNGDAAKAEACGAGGDCSFADTASMYAKRKIFGITIEATENCTISGDITSVTGELDISESSGGSACTGFSQPEAEAEICQHAFTEEYWIRLPLNTGSVATVGFGHIVASPAYLLKSSVPTDFLKGIEFGDDEDATTASFSFKYGGTGSYVPWFQRADFDEMWSSGQVLVGKGPTGQCEWPELS